MKADHVRPDAGATSLAAVTPLSVMSLTLRLTIACMDAAQCERLHRTPGGHTWHEFPTGTL